MINDCTIVTVMGT